MIDAIYIFGIFLGLVLGFRGIILIYFSKRPLNYLFGVNLSSNILKIDLLFFAIILSLFALLTTINYLKGYVLNLSFIPSASVILNVPTFLLAATLEEMLFRALLFASLIHYVNNKNMLILLTSILFALYHFPNNVLHFTSYLLGGIMYGYAFVKFQSLLVPIGIHFSWNYVQGALFGYPVSGHEFQGLISMALIPNVYYNGGSQGPEGSIAGIIIRLIIVLMIYILSSKELNEKFLNLPIKVN